MTSMSGFLIVMGAAAALLPLSGAQHTRLERGKYLTEEVAKCQECHTQRLQGGELDQAAWLKGAGKPVVTAPDITSGGELWKQWGENGLLRYLETGKDPAGKTAAAPMPAYRLRRDDAEAIVAYLKSLR